MADNIRAVMAKAQGKSELDATKVGMGSKKAGMVDMKISKAEVKKKNSPMAYPGDNESYPYGLSIRLDNDAMKKLGINLPDVGETVDISAKAMVTEASANETTNGGKRLSCTLQITKLQVKE